MGSIILAFSGQEASGQENAERTEHSASLQGQQEKIPLPSTTGIGVLEVPRPDGGKDKIYYSTITREEELQTIKEEKEKTERSWEMLRNVIIDKRSK